MSDQDYLFNVRSIAREFIKTVDCDPADLDENAADDLLNDLIDAFADGSEDAA